MKNVLLLSLVLLITPFAAAAESEACVPICETYRECAGSALKAIFDGAFSGAMCSGYQSCQNVVLECRAAAGACERECEPTEWG